MPFPCPDCGKDAKSKDSRPAGTDTDYRTRRYHCLCGQRFSTVEVMAKQDIEPGRPAGDNLLNIARQLFFRVESKRIAEKLIELAKELQE